MLDSNTSGGITARDQFSGQLLCRLSMTHSAKQKDIPRKGLLSDMNSIAIALAFPSNSSFTRDGKPLLIESSMMHTAEEFVVSILFLCCNLTKKELKEIVESHSTVVENLSAFSDSNEYEEEVQEDEDPELTKSPAADETSGKRSHDDAFSSQVYKLSLGVPPEVESRMKELDRLRQWEYQIRGLLCRESISMLNH
jgi:hypothetical protein